MTGNIYFNKAENVTGTSTPSEVLASLLAANAGAFPIKRTLIIDENGDVKLIEHGFFKEIVAKRRVEAGTIINFNGAGIDFDDKNIGVTVDLFAGDYDIYVNSIVEKYEKISASTIKLEITLSKDSIIKIKRK